MAIEWAPAPPVVPGCAQETAVRATYVSWARSALGTIAAARTGDHAGSAGWPPGEPVDGLSGVEWTRRPVDAARSAARERALRAGWLLDLSGGELPADPGGDPSLAGLEVAVKDVIDVAGLPTRNGTAGGLWREPDRSAAAWELLRLAGARCAGKAATHEMAWGVTTPRVPNPFDAGRSAGGSSGGSAAAVTVGACDAGLGTDTAGSVRIPAALCGVVGLRPTTGATPMEGVTPLAPEQDVVGVLAADVETCAAIAQRLLGRPLSPPRKAARGFRIGVLTSTGRLTPAVRRAYEDAVRRLAGAGPEVVEVTSDLPRRSTGLSLLTMLRSSARRHAADVRADPDGFSGEVRALLTLGEELPADVLASGRSELTAETAALFAEHRLDVLLTPTTPCTAPLRTAAAIDLDGRPEAVSAALTRFTAWASVAGMPALSIPVATPGPLPWGVQVMAPPGSEHRCVGLGALIETVTRTRNGRE
jgi:aspartyl-tRNA(Asn)/glutamyl-tRNA(Gln) amidotransferase subunit A